MIADYTVPTLAYTARFVEQAHRGQRYGDWPNIDGTVGDPYVTHVRDVARRLRPHGVHAVMAGLLHDTVEDTPVTLGLLAELGFPDQVIAAVDAVTRRPDEEYDDLIKRAVEEPLGCLVKLADNISNTEALPQLIDRRRRHRLERKYLRARRWLLPAYEGLQGFAYSLGQDRLMFGRKIDDGEDW